jgi:sucrose phosphorylase
VRPLEGLLPESEIDTLVAAMEQRGGLIGRRSGPDGSASPYELNITYFDALSIPGAPDDSVERFLCSQTIALGLQGIPGIYFNSLLGASNDLALVEATGRARSINRGKWTEAKLDAILSAESGHQGSRVFPELLRRLRIRARQPALHPDAAQQILDLPAGLFGLRRDGAQRLWMIANLSGEATELAMGRVDHNWRRHRWVDLLGGWHGDPDASSTKLPLAPYQVVWLAVADEQPSAVGRHGGAAPITGLSH